MPSAWQIHDAKPTSRNSLDTLNNLKLNEDVPKPTQIGPNGVLVRIRAAAINSRDIMIIAHDPLYPDTHKNDLVPCSDGAGEIEAIGANSVWKVGDRVIIHANSWLIGYEAQTMDVLGGKGGGKTDGTLRQYAVLKDIEVYSAPAHLSFEESAALPTAAGTAANALLFGPKRLEAGMKIVTQGTGGVSSFAIQLASALGAIVIATSSSNEKLKVAKQLGASHLINYRTTPEWGDEVLRLTNGNGVDHVIEVGGAQTIEQSLKATKQGGLISVIGILSESKKVDIIPSLLYGAKTLRGVFGSASKPMAEEMAKTVEEKKIHPFIAEIYEWEDAKEAFKAAIQQTGVGKIVIRV